MNDRAWRNAALCRATPTPDLWFSDDRAETALAKEFCGMCPVQQECLLDAIATDETNCYGVRGGLTALQRARARGDRTRSVTSQKLLHEDRVATARILTLRGEPADFIAEQLGVNIRTIVRWRSAGRWTAAA